MNQVVLSLGTNLGNRHANLKRVVQLINQRVAKVVKMSSVYESAPWGYRSQNNFLNQVVIIKSSETPYQILSEVLRIESFMGRLRHENKFEDRIIDVDILLYEDVIISGKNLTLPHPDMHLRRFILIPFAETAGEMMHPKLNLSIKDLLINCDDKSHVQAIYQPSAVH